MLVAVHAGMTPSQSCWTQCGLWTVHCGRPGLAPKPVPHPATKFPGDKIAPAGVPLRPLRHHFGLAPGVPNASCGAGVPGFKVLGITILTGRNTSLNLEDMAEHFQGQSRTISVVLKGRDIHYTVIKSPEIYHVRKGSGQVDKFRVAFVVACLRHSTLTMVRLPRQSKYSNNKPTPTCLGPYIFGMCMFMSGCRYLKLNKYFSRTSLAKSVV